MNLKVKNSDFIEYIFLFGNDRNAFHDICVKSALKSQGLFCVFQDNDEPVAFITACNSENEILITDLFVKEENRNKGIGSFMLKHAVDNLYSRNKKISLNINESHKCFTYIDNICKGNNFLINATMHIYSAEKKDFFKWTDYMNKSGNKLVNYLKHCGFECVSLDNLTDEQMVQLCNSNNSEYNTNLSAKDFIDNNAKKLAYDMSFAAFKDNILCAYSLISRPDEKSAIFEQISVSEKYRTTGVILFPFSESMRMFEANGCERANYTMYDTNISVLNFKNKLLNNITQSVKTAYHYTYNK